MRCIARAVPSVTYAHGECAALVWEDMVVTQQHTAVSRTLRGHDVPVLRPVDVATRETVMPANRSMLSSCTCVHLHAADIFARDKHGDVHCPPASTAAPRYRWAMLA
jgi:hypothetical protein